MSSTKSSGMEELLKKERKTPITQLHRGDVVRGTIITLNERGGLVDVGAKSEGMVPLNEVKSAGLKPGDTVFVYVLTPEDRQGQLLLSLERAVTIKTWVDLEEAFKQGSTVESVVTGSNKGGLTVAINDLVGFVPFSHTESVSDAASDKEVLQQMLDKIIGQTIKARIIELDKDKNRIILSEKEALIGAALEQRRKALGTIAAGDRVTVKVSAVMPYGLMVELGEGLEGLIPREELTWDEEMIDELLAGYEGGETITADVTEVDSELGKVRLSLKQTTQDPWKMITEQHAIGDVVEVPVARLTSYGVLVTMPYGLEGLVSLSSIPDDAELQVGKPIKVTIDFIDPTQKRVDVSYAGK